MNYRTSTGMMLSKGISGRLFAPNVTYSTTHRARASGVATLTFSSHKMSVGCYVYITAVGGTGYNGWSLITSTTSTQITYSNPGSNEGTTADASGKANVYPSNEHMSVNSSMSIGEVQNKLDSFAKLRSAQILIVRFADGTYNWDGPLRVRGFRNYGNVTLVGNPYEVNVAGTRRTNQAAILNFSGSEGILFEDCTRGVVSNMKVITVSSASDGYCVKMVNCHHSYIEYCYMTGSSTNYGAGLSFENSFGSGQTTCFSNIRYAVHAKGKSFVHTQNCGTTGTSVGTGWRSDDGSWISGGHTSYMTGYTSQSSYGTYNPPWLPNTAYSLGTFVSRKVPAGVKFECTRAGTSGASEPTWPSVGSTVNDPNVSGVQWTGRTDNTVSRLSLGGW